MSGRCSVVVECQAGQCIDDLMRASKDCNRTVQVGVLLYSLKRLEQKRVLASLHRTHTRDGCGPTELKCENNPD